MASGDLLTTKIRHGFDCLDADGDGRLDEQDHVLMGQRLAATLGHPTDSPAEHRLIDMYLRIWRDMHVPNLPDGEDAIPRDRFVAGVQRIAAEDPEIADAALGAAAETFMEVVDLDSDGQISPDEYRTFMRGHCPDVSDADMSTAFGHLDLNGDGHLSAAEFRQAVVEFWTSDDPDAPGNWWLGPVPGVHG